MYALPQYRENDPDEMIRFIRKNSFAILAGADAYGKPVATQVPLLAGFAEDEVILRGHIMKNTDHHLAFMANPLVLALFTGPHAYVSASWYKNPQQASTWNYMTVHARGKIRFVDEDNLLNILKDTTAIYENNASSPASYDQLPEEYVTRLRKAIVGFEIVVEELEGVFKLSQNRDHESYKSIIARLNEGDGAAKEIAEEMRQREEQLFRD